MDTQGFYALVSGTCFTLVGLWWNVVRGRTDWLKNPELRQLATGINLSFLIPALISMVASIGGDNPFIWRGIFIIAGVYGIWFTTRLMHRTSLMAVKMGMFHRNRWGLVTIYVLMLVLSVLPAPWIVSLLGLQPLQLGGILLAMLVLIGNGLTWEFMTTETD